MQPGLRAAEHRVQVALAEVTPAGKLERHGLRLAAEPVYPASCIKLCAAVAAPSLIFTQPGLPLGFLLSVFKAYAAHTDGAFAMNLTSFTEFVTDCDMVDNDHW